MAPSSERLRQLLGVRHPLIQAPMAGVQGHELAVAASRAGALGSLPSATFSPQALQTELQALVAAMGRAGEASLPWALNFFCHAPPGPQAADQEARWCEAVAPWSREAGLAPPVPGGAARAPFSDALADLIEPIRPPVLSFHFGLPAPHLVARVKRWGARVLSSATTVEEARWLEAHGADAVIAQGWEAGGHRGHFLRPDRDTAGQTGLFALLPQVVQAVRVPVIAAGGIVDAATVQAALALGAAGVQAGTVFLCCTEARTSAVHRAALAGTVEAWARTPRSPRPSPADRRAPWSTAGCASRCLCGTGCHPSRWPPVRWPACARRAKPQGKATSRPCGPVRTPAPAAPCRLRRSWPSWRAGLARIANGSSGWPTARRQ